MSQPLDVKPAPTKRIQKTAGHVKPIHRCPFFERRSMQVANYANCRSIMPCVSLVSNKNRPPFWQSHPRSRPGHICLAASRKFSPKMIKSWVHCPFWPSPSPCPRQISLLLARDLEPMEGLVLQILCWTHGCHHLHEKTALDFQWNGMRLPHCQSLPVGLHAFHQ